MSASITQFHRVAITNKLSMMVFVPWLWVTAQLRCVIIYREGAHSSNVTETLGSASLLQHQLYLPCAIPFKTSHFLKQHSVISPSSSHRVMKAIKVQDTQVHQFIVS